MADLNYSDRFWKKWYKMSGLPEELPDPEQWIIEGIFKVWSQKLPQDKVGIVSGGYEMTVGETMDMAKRLVSIFKGLNMQKGGIVATWMGNGIPLAVCPLGIMASNLTWQPISSLQKAPELERQLRESGAKTIICHDTYLEIVESVRKKTALENIIVVSDRDFTAVQDVSVAHPPGAYNLRKLLTEYEPATPVFDWGRDDVAVLLFTGGATGVPKGVQTSMGNCSYYEQLLTGTTGPLLDILVGNLSMVVAQHIFHVGIITWIIALRLGCTLYVVRDPRDTRSIYQYLTKPGVFFSLFAPGQIARMAELEGFDMKKIGHVMSLSGMASLSPELGDKYRKKTGTSPFQAYGQSESTALITANIPAILSTLGMGAAAKDPRRQEVLAKTMPFIAPRAVRLLAFVVKLIGPQRLFGSSRHRVMGFLNRRGQRTRTEERIKEDIKSIGIPSFNTDVKLVDMDDKTTIVPVGEVGEICFKGPQRMLGYLKTEEGYTGPGYDDEGYVHTGDAAYMDEDGLLYLVDRTRDMINVSGFKVYGTTVEDVVYQHPAIAMCAAFSVPDRDDPTNERVKLAVQLKKGYEPSKAIEDEILKLCEEKLAPYAKPRYIEFMEEIPMMHTDKVDKLFLREREKKLLSEMPD